jgi:hypothetical protein
MHGWHMARQRKILTITHLLSILPTLHTYPAFRNQTFPLRRTNSRAEHLIVFSPPGSFLFLAVAWMETHPPAQGKGQKNWHSISIIGTYIFFSSVSRALGRYIRGFFSPLLIPPHRFCSLVKRLYIPGRWQEGLRAGFELELLV